MPRLPSSTAFRFAAFYSATFTLLIVAMGAAMYWGIRHELRYDLEQRVVTERDAIRREIEDGGLAQIVAERARFQQGDMRYALLDRTEKLIAGRAIIARPPLGWSDMYFVKDNGDPDLTRAYSTATADGGLLIVGADPEAIEDLNERMIPLFAVAFGLIVVIGAGGAFLLSGALGRRLNTITRTAHAIIGGDLTQRVPLSGSGDDFDRLATTLNQMLDRIAALLDNLRQVSGDVAHDLRTPIARLRQKLDLALTGERDEVELRAAMQHAVEQTEDILELFTGILSISEVEAGASVTKQPFDLSALMTDLADVYQPAAEEQSNRVFERDIAPDIAFDGNRGLIAQLATNLLDNALRHTPPGVGLALGLSGDAETVTITVADHGEGIPADQRDSVFSRFTRLDSSRTTPGHGLGLSLVEAIARAHGGTVRLEDNHPGVKAMVILPRRPQ